jgi:3-oxoacyl-[acyl-carrier protein] reductase
MGVNVDLSGKVALVTGASRGIGKAIGSKLAGAGAKVAVADVMDLTEIQAAADEIGGGAIAVSADVTTPEQVDAAVSEIEERLGPIDVLVNNAGITRDGLLLRMSDKAVARRMMKRRTGRIVNIASVVGITGNRGQANYSASKAGLIGFTKSIAKELASRNVLVNAVAPGFIDTVMTQALSEDVREALLQQVPLGRLGSPADVANVVLFLSSDLAGYVTGQVVVVDGGMVM